jgi:hypothetical protein
METGTSLKPNRGKGTARIRSCLRHHLLQRQRLRIYHRRLEIPLLNGRLREVDANGRCKIVDDVARDPARYLVHAPGPGVQRSMAVDVMIDIEKSLARREKRVDGIDRGRGLGIDGVGARGVGVLARGNGVLRRLRRRVKVQRVHLPRVGGDVAGVGVGILERGGVGLAGVLLLRRGGEVGRGMRRGEVEVAMMRVRGRIGLL